MNIKHLLLIPALILSAHAESLTMGKATLPTQLRRAAYDALESDGGYFWGEKTTERVIKEGNILMLMDGKYCLLEASIHPYMRDTALLVTVL